MTVWGRVGHSFDVSVWFALYWCLALDCSGPDPPLQFALFEFNVGYVPSFTMEKVLAVDPCIHGFWAFAYWGSFKPWTFGSF